MTDTHSGMEGQCIALYGPDAGAHTHTLLQALIAAHQTHPKHAPDLTERDAMLIAYGDHVRAPNVPPLRTLGKVCETYLGDAVPCLHILPFYPYTSDDGFSVSDYCAVDPALGTWADIEPLAQRLRLMFDAVINHASTQHAWFQGFLKGDPKYQDYFVTVDGNPDLTQVVRPRTLPLLTPFQTANGNAAGTQHVWTTFSADQVDLNYGNPQVLLEIVDLLLFYATQGAEFIRLDAIAYLWKEIGTACIHLPQTHLAIQLIRAALDAAAPHVKLITETNVPHVDNVAYFGDGTNEAQLVYNFALPPLTLHTLHSGDATLISEWASNLVLPTDQTTFFNFLASHDGIGLNPARGILSEPQIDELVTAAQRAGGKVGYKNNSDGTQSPYELNINYFDALAAQGNDADSEDQSEEQSINRFIAAHAIMFSLIGMPGIYFHSLFGSRGWPDGVAQLGHNRAINREKLNLAELEESLHDRHSRRSRVLSRLTQLLRVRGQHAAFDPYGSQRIVKGIASTFVVQRIGRRSRQPVLCLINVTHQPTQVTLPWRDLLGTDKAADDLVSAGRCMLHGLGVSMEPYQIRWLTP